MIISPYETTALKSHAGIQQLLHRLTQGVISGEFVEMVGYEGQRDFDVYAVVEPNEQIDVFYHPVIVEPTHRKPCIVYDARPYAKNITVAGDKTGTITGVNDTLNLLQITAVLMGIWKDRPNDVINVSDIPLTVYASLITENLARRIGLDPSSQVTVMATFQLFYATRGYKTLTRIDSSEKNLLITSLSRKLNVTPDTYAHILDQMEEGDFMNFVSVVSFIERMNISPRLKNIKASEIMSMVMNSWVGQGNPRETMVASLEFPPIFVAICYLMSKSTFYQKTPIGQIIKRINRGNNLKNFNQQLTYLLR